MHKDDQTTWDGLVAQCSDGSFSSINVASWKRSRAIMNVDAELRALRREVAALRQYDAPDEVIATTGADGAEVYSRAAVRKRTYKATIERE